MDPRSRIGQTYVEDGIEYTVVDVIEVPEEEMVRLRRRLEQERKEATLQ